MDSNSNSNSVTLATSIAVPLSFIHPLSGEYISNITWPGVSMTLVNISDTRYLPYIRTPAGAPMLLNQSYDTLALELHTLNNSAAWTLNHTVSAADASSPTDAHGRPHDAQPLLSLSYVLRVNGTESAATPLQVQQRSNVAPTAGSAGYALRCDGRDDYAFADNFTWRTDWPVTVEAWVRVVPNEVRTHTQTQETKAPRALCGS